jgi:hypothetical protein
VSKQTPVVKKLHAVYVKMRQLRTKEEALVTELREICEREGVLMDLLAVWEGRECTQIILQTNPRRKGHENCGGKCCVE